MKKTLVIASVLMVSSCASIITGTKQDLKITSTPEGAKCVLFRDESSDVKNVVIATAEPTPEQTTVQKTKYDITVKCNKDNLAGSTVLDSGVEGWTFGNILIGGLIGWGIDSATGADNKYPSFTNVPLAAK